METPEFTQEQLAIEVAKCRGRKVTLDPGFMIALVAIIQLASRHPTAKHMATFVTAERFARQMQAFLAEDSEYVDRLLERGWHPVFDAPREGK